MREGIRRAGRSRRQVMALAVAAGCLGVLALPGGASASTIGCRGKIVANPDNPEPNSFKYQLRCNEDIKAFSIITNREVDYFSPDVIGFDGEEATTDAMACEGPFPGSGFGCYGTILTGHKGIGEIGFSKDPCARHPKNGKFRIWMTATTVQTDPVKLTTYINSSQPYELAGPGCKAQPKKNKKHRH